MLPMKTIVIESTEQLLSHMKSLQHIQTKYLSFGLTQALFIGNLIDISCPNIQFFRSKFIISVLATRTYFAFEKISRQGKADLYFCAIASYVQSA